MAHNLSRFQPGSILVLGLTALLFLPGAVRAQSPAPQDRPAAQNQNDDDVTRRDLARFDQFLDGHREDAAQLRKTPSLVDDPQYLQSHPELNAYLQDHPSVKQEISQQPDTFMRLEDRYDRDHDARDRDAGAPDRDRDAYRDRDRDADRRELANFNRFLDDHREVGEQLRKDPSLADNREFVQNHPALGDYLRDHPGVRDQLKQDPNAFMHQEERYQRDAEYRDRDGRMGDRDGDRDRRDLADFDRFLDRHREISEQLRRNPQLADNREFVQNHPALQDFYQNNPGVRDQLQQDPNRFMHEEDRFDRTEYAGNRDPMHDHMADFGGFLGGHSDVRNDLSRDPSVVKDHVYLQNHAELNTYLDAHPAVRDDLMANPHEFVKGAQQYSNGSGTGAGAANGSGSGSNQTQTQPPPSTPKPKQ